MKKCFIIFIALLLSPTFVFAQDDLPCEYSKRNHIVEMMLPYDIWGEEDCHCNEGNYSPLVASRHTSNVIDLTWAQVYDPTDADFGYGVFLYNIYQCDPHPNIDWYTPWMNWNTWFWVGDCNPSVEVENDSTSLIQLSVSSTINYGTPINIINLSSEIKLLESNADSLHLKSYLVKKENTYGFFASSTGLTCEEDSITEAYAEDFVIDEFLPASSYLSFDENGVSSVTSTILLDSNEEIDGYKLVTFVYSNAAILNAIESEITFAATTGYYNCGDTLDMDTTSIDSSVAVIPHLEEQLWSVIHHSESKTLLIESYLDTELLLFTADGKLLTKIDRGRHSISLENYSTGILILSDGYSHHEKILNR